MAAKRGGNSDDALKRALRYLSYCPRSEAEVRRKLGQLGFASAVADATIKRLHSLEYLDDGKFARGFVRSRVEGRGYGPLRIETELRARGVEATLIQTVIQETFPEAQGKERAGEILGKRFGGKDLREEKNLRRAISFLRRRGYRDSVIAEVLRLAADE